MGGCPAPGSPYIRRPQNIQQFRWELERVQTERERTMRKAYGAVTGVAQQKKLGLRTARARSV